MSIRLYVGNLPKSDVERDALQAVFAEAGDLVSTKVIKDRKTGKCRGFGFVTVDTDEQADRIIEKYNGAMFQDLPIKIEKALPKAKGEEEGGEGEEVTETPVTSKPNTANKNSNPARRSSGKKGGRKDNSGKNSSPAVYKSNEEGFQPDPRWASTLAEIKDKLAQAGNA
jgi:RNA recognition motif-containing protein